MPPTATRLKEFVQMANSGGTQQAVFSVDLRRAT